MAPTDLSTIHQSAVLALAQGDRARAERIVQTLLARVHMMVGNHDQAVELLKEPVTVPNNLSKAWLRVDPTWDPLRRHPGFQRLVAGD